MPPSPKQPDPLQDLLSDAETELSRRLREACDAEQRGISTESTAEIRKLEDALLAAAVAAQQTIDVRRHIRERDKAEPQPEGAEADVADGAKRAEPAVPDEMAASAGSGTTPPPATTSRLREFTDAAGRGWRAWPVTPGLDRRTGSDRRFLGDFEEGWICFEALDSSARRRLPCRMPNWSGIEAGDLQRLLDRAIDAPVRKPHQLDASPGPGSGNLPA